MHLFKWPRRGALLSLAIAACLLGTPSGQAAPTEAQPITVDVRGQASRSNSRADLPSARDLGLPSTPAEADAAGRPLVILNDRGGSVLSALARRAKLERWGGRVEIRSACISACTVLITLPNACLGPGTSIAFHAPRIYGTNIVPPGVVEMMAATYRGGIRDKWLNDWSKRRSLSWIKAPEYVKLDPRTKLCTY